MGFNSGKKEVPMLYIYSGHDSTLSPLLGATADLAVHVPMGSNLVFEIHRKGHKEYVKTLYNMTPVNLPQCSRYAKGPLCPVKTFFQILDSIRPEDYDKECQIQSDEYHGK